MRLDTRDGQERRDKQVERKRCSQTEKRGKANKKKGCKEKYNG